MSNESNFYPQYHSNFIVNVTSENLTEVHAKEYTNRSVIWLVNLNFLTSSRHFNCDTAFAVIVSFRNENVHRFKIIRNRRVKTRFQRFEFSRLWKFPGKKHELSLRYILTLMDRIFLKVQPPNDLPDSVAPMKSLWKNWVYCAKRNVQTH